MAPEALTARAVRTAAHLRDSADRRPQIARAWEPRAAGSPATLREGAIRLNRSIAETHLKAIAGTTRRRIPAEATPALRIAALQVDSMQRRGVTRHRARSPEDLREASPRLDPQAALAVAADPSAGEAGISPEAADAPSAEAEAEDTPAVAAMAAVIDKVPLVLHRKTLPKRNRSI